MFQGQWDINISILGNGFSVSVPMILVWLILFLTGLTLILAQLDVTYLLPSGEQVVTNIFEAFFHWLVTGLRGI